MFNSKEKSLLWVPAFYQPKKSFSLEAIDSVREKLSTFGKDLFAANDPLAAIDNKLTAEDLWPY